MSRWPRGEAQIEQLIANKQLQQVIGGQANGAHLLQKASRTLETAGEIADQDPDSAYVLAYDAARYSGTAILAQQGLRPTTSGGHYRSRGGSSCPVRRRVPALRSDAATTQRTRVPHWARRDHHA